MQHQITSEYRDSFDQMAEFFRILGGFLHLMPILREKFEHLYASTDEHSKPFLYNHIDHCLQQFSDANGATLSSSSSSPSPTSFNKVVTSGTDVPEESKVAMDFQWKRNQLQEDIAEDSSSALDSLAKMTVLHSCDAFEAHLVEEPVIVNEDKQLSTDQKLLKRRKTRTTFTTFQLAKLEVYFGKQKYLTPTDRDRIASELGLSNTQVITWFQNRRAKRKRERNEQDSDVYAPKFRHLSAFGLCRPDSQSVAALTVAAHIASPSPPLPTMISNDQKPARTPVAGDQAVDKKLPPEVCKPTSMSSVVTKRIWRPICLDELSTGPS